MAVDEAEPPKISLLYVDDEPVLLELCTIFLERSGNFSVTTAQGAPEGLRLLSERPFDAILSDYQMPEMDGIEFLKHLKKSGDSTPFLIFTGKGREEVVIEALNNGADFYIQKGGDPKSQFAELINKIRYAVARRRAEEALRQSEERYRLIADNTADNIWIFDMKFQMTYISPSVKKMRGFTVEEDLAQSLEDKMTQESCQMIVSRFQEELALEMTGNADPDRTILFETEEYCKDGSTIWVENAVRALRNKEGNLMGVLGISRDITWRKEADKALRLSEGRYRSLAENSPVGIVTCDADGIIDYINPKMVLMLSLPGGSDDAIGNNLFTFPPLATPKFTEILRRTLTTGEAEDPTEIECQSRGRDTVRYWGHISPLTADGSVWGAQVILTDVNGYRRDDEMPQMGDYPSQLASGILVKQER
ncbi:MAG TPA: response regulator [Methanoculleus sp.]|mgnify:CR=1 FL=1|nr:response regulator [Methanoculleus sp.]